MPKTNSGGAAGMLDGLKSRLGFGRKDDEFYDDDYGYDDDYDDGDYNDGYDNDRVDVPASGYRPLSTSSSTSSRSSRSSRFGHGDSAADNLVSIDDVKASTRAERRAREEGRYSDSASTRKSYGTGSESSRSGGYDSLFESTETPTFTPYEQTETPTFTPYDPYEAYSSSNPSSYATTRPLTVIKPVVYGDVERVARAVKSGDVVVLVMRNTPDDLSKRILDFSFGVASALDANVECPGEKVFAIARGASLTDDEKTRLRNQGAL